MKQLKVFLIALAMVVGFCAEAALKGPYRAQGLAFYFVHNGGPLKVGVNLNSAKNGAVVVKIQNADEKEVYWDYIKFTGKKTVTHDFGKNAPAGIYQMRISGLEYTADPISFPMKKYGVSATRCRFNFNTVDQFKEAYFLIPEGSKELNWYFIGVPFTLSDDTGKVIWKSTPERHGKMDVRKYVGKVLKFSAKAPKTTAYYSFGFGGLPVIFCDDAATAKKINGSIEKAPDGTIYAHKYQVRIHNWLKSLKPEDLKVDIVDLRTLADKFKAVPYKNGIIGPWGVFSYINFQLEKQNLDPNSKNFGKTPSVSAMGVVNSLKAPYNPYTGKLDNRILIGALPIYLTMKENDTREESHSDYAGGDALFYIDHARSYYESVRSIKDPAMRELWYDAVKRYPDRFSMFRVSCENQSSHFPYCFQALYETNGNVGYKRLAEDYIHQLNDPEINPFMKTGYQQEAYGPDGTYQGLGQSLQALYYRMSGNKEALDGCLKVHDFFSHSVIREPDGRIVGSSNFSHRTAGGWNVAQFSAGWVLMQHKIESAAVFAAGRDSEKSIEVLKDLAPRSYANPHAIGYSMASFGPYLNYIRYRTEPIKNPKFPHEKAGNFTRNFNNEFLAVKKNNYYMFTYLKGTASAWTKGQRFKTVENPKLPVYKWTQLQGTAVLAFEGYGAFMTGMNWSGNTFHMLRGDLPDGKLAYPDYWNYSARVLRGGSKILARGGMFQADGVNFTRYTECLDNGIRQTVTAKFGKNIKFNRFAEQLPLLVDKPGFSVEYLVDGKWTAKPGKATAVRFCKKIVVKFDKAYPCEIGPRYRNYGQTVAPLLITLGKEFKAGDEVKIVYTITPEK